MNGNTLWAISGLFGVLGVVYQFAAFAKRIKQEEDFKERRQPQTIVYRLGEHSRDL